MTCEHCREPIAKGESCKAMPLVEADGTARVIHQHHECFLRHIFGSVGHQLGLCSCFGGEMDDPPFMSKRGAAKAAVALFTQQLDQEELRRLRS